MEEQIVSFETAKRLRAKGFFIPVLKCYNENEEVGDIEDYVLFNYNQFVNFHGSNTNTYSAPTLSLAQKWLRDNQNIHIEIYYNASGCGWILTKLNGSTIKDIDNDIFFDTYECALEQGIIEALKLIK